MVGGGGNDVIFGGAGGGRTSPSVRQPVIPATAYLWQSFADRDRHLMSPTVVTVIVGKELRWLNIQSL